MFAERTEVYLCPSGIHTAFTGSNTRFRDIAETEIL